MTKEERNEKFKSFLNEVMNKIVDGIIHTEEGERLTERKVFEYRMTRGFNVNANQMAEEISVSIMSECLDYLYKNSEDFRKQITDQAKGTDYEEEFKTLSFLHTLRKRKGE